MFIRVFVVCFVLAGCSVFAPEYVRDADIRTTDAYEKISIVLARAELGQFENGDNFKEVSNTYAEIIGQLETARLAVTGGQQDSENNLLGQSKKELNAVIDSCIKLVTLFAEEHESTGIIAGIGATQGVRVACDQAVRAIRATI